MAETIDRLSVPADLLSYFSIWERASLGDWVVCYTLWFQERIWILDKVSCFNSMRYWAEEMKSNVVVLLAIYIAVTTFCIIDNSQLIENGNRAGMFFLVSLWIWRYRRQGFWPLLSYPLFFFLRQKTPLCPCSSDQAMGTKNSTSSIVGRAEWCLLPRRCMVLCG